MLKENKSMKVIQPNRYLPQTEMWKKIKNIIMWKIISYSNILRYCLQIKHGNDFQDPSLTRIIEMWKEN